MTLRFEDIYVLYYHSYTNKLYYRIIHLKLVMPSPTDTERLC